MLHVLAERTHVAEGGRFIPAPALVVCLRCGWEWPSRVQVDHTCSRATRGEIALARLDEKRS